MPGTGGTGRAPQGAPAAPTAPARPSGRRPPYRDMPDGPAVPGDLAGAASGGTETPVGLDDPSPGPDVGALPGETGRRTTPGEIGTGRTPAVPGPVGPADARGGPAGALPVREEPPRGDTAGRGPGTEASGGWRRRTTSIRGVTGGTGSMAVPTGGTGSMAAPTGGTGSMAVPEERPSGSVHPGSTPAPEEVWPSGGKSARPLTSRTAVPDRASRAASAGGTPSRVSLRMTISRSRSAMAYRRWAPATWADGPNP